MDGFASASFDDHVKVFFPIPGDRRPARPVSAPDGRAFFPEGRPVSRDFTPCRHDVAKNEIELEFVLHEGGTAGDWARQAKPGQMLGIAGPRGSKVIPTGFDWHVLIGDETALPAIGRRLEELPERVLAIAVIEVVDASEEVTFSAAGEPSVIWCHRRFSVRRGAALMRVLHRLVLPEGEGFVWAAGESSVIREVRRYLCAERGVAAKRINTAGYWKDGAVDVHERIED